MIGLTKTAWSASDNRQKQKALEQLGNKVEKLAKAANESEQTKNLIVSLVERTGGIIGACVPPVVKTVLDVPITIVVAPFKWMTWGQNLSFSQATIKMAQKGLIGLFGPMIFAWWMAGILVRSIDQLKMPSSGGNETSVGSSVVKNHGKKAPDLKKLRVHRRLLVGYGNCAFDLPYNNKWN